tara:strand:- start:19511 stop:21439 length:1929 start_codon:yes stop_codon:yes gene_type:complete
MIRTAAIAALTILTVPTAWSAESAKTRRPNIVLILADDLGYETVGCYGGTSYRTPNIDRLAAQGIRFDHAYAMPLCTNTRVQLMTGKYNNRNWKSFGILDPAADTFGHMMQRAGYKTCIAGKWQMHSYDPPDYPGAALRRSTGMLAGDAGFHEYSLWHTGHTEDKGSRYADPVIDENGTLRRDTLGKYGPDLWVEFIGDFMRRHRDEPFFVYYPMALPHNPMVPTPDSPEWDDPARRHSDETPFAADMIEYTDKLVGRVVRQVEELGLRENTLILFYSDNGTNARVASQMGQRRVRGEKGLGTDLGIRVPMIANWKGVTPTGVVSNDLIDSVDFLPTILEVAGATDQIHEPIDGISFNDVIGGDGPSQRQWVYVHQDPRPGWDKDRFYLIRLARDQHYKLHQDGRLYCTRDDPFEESPIYITDDTDESREARIHLQGVLDSMKPYRMFDPDEMPRPNPTDPIANNEFHDMGGYAVIEAEMTPTPRDESWRSETNLSGYSGTGYLRSVRDQPEAPEKGVTPIHVNIGTAGPWNIAFRCRSDHVSDQQEREFWVRVGQGNWLIGRLPADLEPGRWHWTSDLVDPATNRSVSPRFVLTEKRNDILIAPRTLNLKIDRVVVFEDDRFEKATDLSTPVSPFHPWASP